MKLDTLLWLLPVVFMIHDFEEIIFLPSWLRRHQTEIISRSPAFSRNQLHALASMSTSAFTLAVMVVFVSLSVFTLLTVENDWPNVWAGMAVLFGLHAVVHLLQSVMIHRYVPLAATSLIGILYASFALYQLAAWGLIEWRAVLFSAAALLPFTAIVLVFAHRLARWFDSRTGTAQ